jgi:POT family proton-dependent oligopeptide transporter
VLGNGLFKPNISTQVGNLYPQGDPRRDSAFSIFYFGINIGGGLSPWVGGIVRQHYGFPAAFATAGIGMLISMVIFAVFHHHVAVANIRSSVSAVLDIPLPQEYEDPRDPPEVERKRILALVIICSIVMMFWMAFQQSGITLSLWARDNTVRTITLVDLHLRPWRVEILPEWFQSVNSVFILTLTPVVVWLFGWLRKSNREPSTPIKIALGMILTALSYVLMVIGSLVGGDKGRVSMLWLISCYFVITIAELFLSPIGLSLVSKLAPRRMTAMLIGVWFIATAIGNKLAGELGRLWSHWPHSRFFALLVASSLIAALILKTQLKRLRASMPPEGPPPDASRSGAELKPAPATT